MGGRLPKPLALALVERGGKQPRKEQRERAARAPQAIIGLPEPPFDLTASQRALWLDLVAVSPGGLFCRVDAVAFESYVVLVDMQREQLRIVNGDAPLLKKDAREEYKRLAVMLRAWQNDFGFNPIARLRVQTVPEPPQGKTDPRKADPLLRFLGSAA